MAMYKEADITADLIKEKFPGVAAELAAGAKELTLESVKSDFPDIAASLIDEGKKSVDLDAQIEAAVVAEHERIRAIEAIVAPGFESIVADAKFDRSATVESVKIKLFDAQQQMRAKAKNDLVADGEEVAVLVQNLDNDIDDTKTAEEKERELALKMAEKITI